MTIRLWIYDDSHDIGKTVARVAESRGHDVRLFEDARQPDEGYVFMHMHHHPQVRMIHKRIVSIMAMNPHLTLIPDYRSAMLYDDKLEQARQLSRWMPRTHVFYTPNAARRFLDRDPKIPFISKASEGASSHNVRFIKSFDEARIEIKHAFSDLGIKLRYSQIQRGYVLWQEFIEGNTGDVRIIAVGSQRLILRRQNRDDRPMASGSGRLEPIVKLDPELEQALAVANQFFAQEDQKWAGIDLVKDASGRWYVLETTVSWTFHGYYECQFIGTHRKGDAIWDVLLDEVEAGAFN